MEFGQAYCQDPIKSILQKFTMYFSELYFIFYEFWKLYEFLKIFNRIKKKEKR
jgi:hypothetical protein